MKDTAFSDRMKMYEGKESDRRFIPLLPIMARLDGRSFHSFCRGLERPFDRRYRDLMVAVTAFLVDETGALMGYTQSDEISLLWFSPDPKSQVFFDGRVMKMTSVLAAMASVEFNRRLPEFLPAKTHLKPVFDCRVWQVPNRAEAANVFLWRELDATRNSVSSAAQAHFSHKSLMGLDSAQMQERLFKEKGVNWNDYPPEFKRGVWVQRRRVERVFTTDEIDRLPPKHAARTNPDLKVERWEIQTIPMPPVRRTANREEVIFEGAEPRPMTGTEAIVFEENERCLDALHEMATKGGA